MPARPTRVPGFFGSCTFTIAAFTTALAAITASPATAVVELRITATPCLLVATRIHEGLLITTTIGLIAPSVEISSPSIDRHCRVVELVSTTVHLMCMRVLVELPVATVHLMCMHVLVELPVAAVGTRTAVELWRALLGTEVAELLILLPHAA